MPYSLPVFNSSFREFWNSVTESAGISPNDAICQLCADISHAIPTFEKAFRMARMNHVGTDEEILQMLYNGWGTILSSEYFYENMNIANCRKYFLECQSFFCDMERQIFIFEASSFVNRRKLPVWVSYDDTPEKPVPVKKPEISNLWDRL